MTGHLSDSLANDPHTFFPGLDFTFDRTKQTFPDSSSSCGVLFCQENSQSSSDDNLHTMTSMTLFKTSPSVVSTNGNNRPGQRKRLATVSADQPELEQVSDGMKVRGLLRDGRAFFRVELSKKSDCQAEFICQVGGVDSQGKEVLSSHSLLQPHDQSNIIPRDTGMVPAVLTQLLSLIQSLEVKLAIVERTTERLEDKLNCEENSRELTEKMNLLQNSLEKKLNSVEHSLKDQLLELEKESREQIEQSSAKTTDRLQDKLNSADDKLCQLDSKLSAIDSEAIQDKVLNSMNYKIESYFVKVLNVSAKMDDTLKSAVTLLMNVKANNSQFQINIMENYHSLFQNVTNDLGEVFTRADQLTETIKNSLISFKHDLDVSWERLETSTNNSAIQAFTALHHMTSELNFTLATSMESALTNFFMLKTCEKNKNPPFQLAALFYPYPVFYPRDIPEIQSPLLCDTTTDNGGWIVIQRRHDGEVDFYRDWVAYRNGFGTLETEFWLGNEKIHAITSAGRYELRVDLKYNGQSKYARYDRFSIADESNNYKLTVGSYSGTAGDSMTEWQNGQPFSTYDRDNDRSLDNCAEKYTGAWWYRNCHLSNLNGKWGGARSKGLTWKSLTTYEHAVSFSEMKIRRLG